LRFSVWNDRFDVGSSKGNLSMRLNQNPSRRLALSVFLASTGTLLTGTDPSLAAGHGPLYRTLDAIAGGIEKVIDVAAGAGKQSSGCDDAVCDDGCDPMMLNELGSSMGTPEASTPYHAPHPPMMPVNPAPHYETLPLESMPTESVPADRMPMTPTPMNSSQAPRAVPPVKAAKPSQPTQPAQPAIPAEDDWLDSFSPEPPATAPQTRRGLPTPPPAAANKQPIAVPKRTQLRSPAETFDSLPDPFKDDQSNARKRSPNRQVGYWEPW
jgi:hypothetical protein